VNVRVSRRMKAKRDDIEVEGIDGAVGFDGIDVDIDLEKLRMCVLEELTLRGIAGAIAAGRPQCAGKAPGLRG
jgi:hypothetical protein